MDYSDDACMNHFTADQGGRMNNMVELYKPSLISCDTPPAVPSSTTDSASPVTSNAATLNGTVNPNGASTTVTFEYGATTGYGSTATAVQSPLSGTTAQSVNAGLTGLTPGETYHFRIKATNSAGTSYGSDLAFTTSSQCPDCSGDTVELTDVTFPSENVRVHRYCIPYYRQRGYYSKWSYRHV